MAATFPFSIVTLENTVFDGEIESVTLPTRDGEITVLAHHIPLVSLVRPGELVVRESGSSPLSLAVSEGFVEVRSSGEVIVLADTAERAEHIDIERAQAARERAQKVLEEKTGPAHLDFARMQALLDKEIARIRVGNKYGRK